MEKNDYLKRFLVSMRAAKLFTGCDLGLVDQDLLSGHSTAYPALGISGINCSGYFPRKVIIVPDHSLPKTPRFNMAGPKSIQSEPHVFQHRLRTVRLIFTPHLRPSAANTPSPTPSKWASWGGCTRTKSPTWTVLRLLEKSCILSLSLMNSWTRRRKSQQLAGDFSAVKLRMLFTTDSSKDKGQAAAGLQRSIDELRSGKYTLDNDTMRGLHSGSSHRVVQARMENHSSLVWPIFAKDPFWYGRIGLRPCWSWQREAWTWRYKVGTRIIP